MSKIKRYDQLPRVTKIPDAGTVGAVVGKDLRWPDGTVVQESQIRQSTGTGSTGNAVATLWKLIREIPLNIQRVAALAGAGFTTRDAEGNWRQRAITAGEGITVENGDGTDGAPTVSITPATRTAAGTVSALRVIFESAAGVSHLDPTNDAQVAALIGISTTSADPGGTVEYQFDGDLDDSGWSWSPGFVYAGPDGSLTQTPPADGWEIVVGYAPLPTRINLTFDEPVKLAP